MLAWLAVTKVMGARERFMSFGDQHNQNKHFIRVSSQTKLVLSHIHVRSFISRGWCWDSYLVLENQASLIVCKVSVLYPR